MTGNRKAFLWIMATLIGAVVVASIALTYPTEVAHPVLGDQWLCQKSTIITTCHRVSRRGPITDRARFADTQPV
jgi:hypothetical protein